MGHHVVTNPIRVLSLPVEFRNSRGKYTKPHLATRFYVTIEKIRLEFDVPNFRPKTKDKVVLFATEIVNELKNQFYPSQVEEIEKRLRLKPKKTAKKKTDKVEFNLELSEQEYFSKHELKKLQMKSFYFWFKPPYEISKSTAPEIMKLVYSFAYNRGVEVINEHRLKGWKYQIKILGGGEYQRLKNVGGSEMKLVDDLFGFSSRRVSVPPNRKYYMKDVQYNYQRFIEKVVSDMAKIGSYFSRITQKHLDKNNYNRNLFVHGVKLEFTRGIK